MKTVKFLSVRCPLWHRSFCLVLALVSALVCSRGWAQNSSSAVNGVVTDAAQAVVMGAKVTLKNVDTNVERVTVSNGSGNYFFSNVPPASYTVTFVKQGFQTQAIAVFDVGVAQAVTINATLQVGAVSETVTVEATGAQVESSTAQLGTTIGQRQVNELPLNGRNFTQLLTLTPGVTPVSTGQNSSASNTSNVAGSTVSFPSINGAGNRSTIFLVDGMNDNSAWYNTYAVPPIIDTVEEFKINSHNDSQYGGSLGGVVNMTSKAGSNTYHGSAWEYIRNNSFDAQSYLPSVIPPSYHFNTYGGQAGGAVRIPHLYNGRDKTFFEMGAEITHYAKSGSSNILEPTAAQLGETTYGGPQVLPALDFSSASCPQGGYSTATCQLYDPTAGGNSYAAGANNYGPYRPAYKGNQIPISQLNPYSIAYIKAIFTQAPIVIPGVAATTANQQITAATTQKTYNYTGRIDQHIGTRDFIFFRYAGFQSYNFAPAGLPTLFTTTELPSQQYGVNWTHIFNASTTMQVQYGKSHVENYVITAFNNPNMWQVFGCSADMCNSYVKGATLMSTISITGGTSGGENNSPTANLSSIHEWQGSVTKTLGKHQFQAGGGWDEVNYTAILQNATVGFTGGATGNFNYNIQNPTPTLASPGCPAGVQCSTVNSVGSGSTATKQSGSGLADFLLDYPNNETKRNVNLTERPGGIGNVYLQDSWKITPKLTFNYGLRYDRSVIPPYGTDGTIGLNGSIETGDFDFNTGDYILQKLPPLCSARGHAPCLPSATLPAHVRLATGAKILHGTKTNFGPRLGVAYRVNDTMSIRAGYGITYDNWAAIIQMTQNYQGSWPDTGTLQINNTNTPGTIYTSAQNPFAANGGNLPSATPFSSSNVNYMVDPQWKNPYSEQYNAGIEQQFGRSTVLSLNYVGSESHRLDIGGYYNTGTPAAGSSFATRQTRGGRRGSPFLIRFRRRAGIIVGRMPRITHYRLRWLGTSRVGLASWFRIRGARHWMRAAMGSFGVEGGVPEDPYNVKGSRGPAGFNLPHILTANVVYELPFGTGKQFATGNRVADYVIGNWQVNSIFVGQSGRNFNVLSGGDIANTGNAGTYERANLVGNPYQSGAVAANPTCVAPAGNTRTFTQWFNPCAFATPASSTLGNAPRNFIQAANYFNIDASIFRIFPIKERLQMKLDLEAFNAINHPIFGTPGSTTTTASTYGIISGSGTNNSARVLQGAVRLQF